MDTHLLAYLAGFIDADGYITVARSRGPLRSDGQRPLYYCAKVAITQLDDAVCRLAAETLGGKVYRFRTVRGGSNGWFQWHCLGGNAVAACEQLKPYLRMKHDHAEIVAQFSELMTEQGRRPSRALITTEMQQARDDLYTHLRNLNSPRDRRRRELVPLAAVQ